MQENGCCFNLSKAQLQVEYKMRNTPLDLYGGGAFKSKFGVKGVLQPCGLSHRTTQTWTK